MAQSPKPVRTQSGLVQGASEDGIAVYKGIPFAAPPLAGLRWRAPQPAADWAGPRARVTRFRWQNRGIAIAGDELTCSGTVAKAEDGAVECELEERNQKGELCASGWARVDLPRRG